MSDNFKSTKFILAYSITLGLFVLTAMRIMDIKDFVTTILGIYGSFIAGNVASKFSPKQ